MIGHHLRNPQWSAASSVIGAVAALSLVLAANVTYAQSNPIPPEIRDLRMGSSTAAVVEKIKSLGTHNTEQLQKENRSMLTWHRPDTPSYKDIEFQFTEKDRLYLIRFVLSDAARTDYHAMKRTVFKDYNFSWERPQKLALPNREMLLYGPEKGMELFFIEFTDKKTHAKSFELFDRSISASDRAEPISLTKKNGKKPESGEQKPAEQSGKTPEGDKAQTAAPTAVTPGEAPKPAEGEKSESAQPATTPNEAAKPAAAEKPEVKPPAASEPQVEKPAGTEKPEVPKSPQSEEKPVSK
jgi:hypothetical protein